LERIALDTDVLIDFLRGKNSAVSFVKRLRDEGAHLATTIINAFELYWGAYRLGGAHRVTQVDRLLNVLYVLPLTLSVVKVAGEEMAYLESVGLPVDVRDLLIGVIAKEHGYVIATKNIEHFNRIRGLSILRYG